MVTAIIGFFNFKFTPYIAGSVTPINAVIPVVRANDLMFLSLLLKETASAAPA
ncbi:hypothetical protein D3C73_1494920 [compost metagenome]